MANPITSPQNPQDRLELANLLYREFQNRCFWHSPPDLEISEDLIAFVVRGLRAHGGHRGFQLAAILESSGSSSTLTEKI